MKECCKNCKLRYDLEKSDYSGKGCSHEDMPGYICMIFASEGKAIRMYGISEESEMCECFTPKESCDERV